MTRDGQRNSRAIGVTETNSYTRNKNGYAF